MSFLTTQEGMTFRCIRHGYSLLACLFWLHRRGWHFVAFAKRIGRVGCEKNWSCLRKEGMIFYYTNTMQGILLGFRLMYPMMCTVHHVGSTWHKKWIFEERHASHSSILDLYVWFTRCIFWNAYNDMKMMVYWGESMQKKQGMFGSWIIYSHWIDVIWTYHIGL